MAEKKTVGGLFVKLVDVMGEIGRVEKRGYNSFHKYSYVTESDLTDVLREKLASRGVIIIPSLQSVQHDDTLTTASMTFTLVDSETGEREAVPWAGCGDDKGDKGLYKAYTGALKYFLMKLFLVSQGDDPEGDTATDRRAEAVGNACPKCGKVKAVIKGKPEFGGGWLCFKKKGGCGATWADGEQDSAPTASLEDVTVNALREQIKGAAQALNDGGDLADDGTEPRWTIQSINAMAKEHFGGPVASLKRESLEHLAEMFSQRLEDQRNGAAQRRQDIIASIQASAPDEEVLAFLQEHHDGKTMEELTTVELNNMSRKVGVPF